MDAEKSRLNRLHSVINKPFYEKDQLQRTSHINSFIFPTIDSLIKLNPSIEILLECEPYEDSGVMNLKSYTLSDNVSDNFPYTIVYPIFSLRHADKYLNRDSLLGNIKGFHFEFDLDSLGSLVSHRIMLHFKSEVVEYQTNFNIVESYGRPHEINERRKEVAERKREEKLKLIEEERDERAKLIAAKLQETEEIKRKQKKATRNPSLPTYMFMSTLNDLEDEYRIIKTNNELTFHTFDFENETIKIEAKRADGSWKIVRLPMKSVSRDRSTYIIKVNQDGFSEAWFSPMMNNLGYDFHNGQRLAYYGIIRVQED